MCCHSVGCGMAGVMHVVQETLPAALIAPPVVQAVFWTRVSGALRSFYQHCGFPPLTLRPCFHTSAILFVVHRRLGCASKPRRLTFTIAAGNVIERQFSSARCAQTTVQIRKEVRTKDERHTDSNSHPHGRVADFDLGTQQNMELRITFHLRFCRFYVGGHRRDLPACTPSTTAPTLNLFSQ
jgi:hypothetical protein